MCVCVLCVVHKTAIIFLYSTNLLLLRLLCLFVCFCRNSPSGPGPTHSRREQHSETEHTEQNVHNNNNT